MNRRRSIRLKDYDYSAPGAYLITICSHQRKLLFGDVVDELIIPSDSGNVVSEAWNEAARRFPSVELDAFVVMPNHVHGIIFLVGAELAEPTANYPNDVGAGIALPGTIAPPSPPTGAASGAPTSPIPAPSAGAASSAPTFSGTAPSPDAASGAPTLGGRCTGVQVDFRDRGKPRAFPFWTAALAA